MISEGKESEDYIDISNISEADIASYYLGVTSIPCLINSPLRYDKNPSFSLFSKNNKDIGYIDFSTKEHGSIIDLLLKMWNCTYQEAKKRILNDLGETKDQTTIKRYTKRISIRKNSDIDLQCKIREWQPHDINYWESYGISLKWLKYADVYPISHKIVIKDGISYTYGADKYAYAYVEFKEGKTTLKIYQPFNTHGFKWANRHDKSVISLWTKVPIKGNRLCICSSLKDALCLWANANIPSIAIQGEGYSISNTAINNLKERYKYIFICLDNDEPGIKGAKQLAKETGFINVVIPPFDEGKDISDLYKAKGKKQFLKIINPLFTNH